MQQHQHRTRPYRLASITEDPSPPTTPISTASEHEIDKVPEDLGSLPPPLRTPRKRNEEAASVIRPPTERHGPSLTSLFQSLRTNRAFSLKSSRPASPMPPPVTTHAEFRKSGTFGERVEETASRPKSPILHAETSIVEITPPRPPRRQVISSLPPAPILSVAGPSGLTPSLPQTPPQSDENRESIEERDRSSSPSPQPQPLVNEADVALLVASHLLSSQATAMLGQSTVLREQAEAMHRLAEQSLEWGRTALALAERSREDERRPRPSSINCDDLPHPNRPDPMPSHRQRPASVDWSSLPREERRRRVVSLPADHNLTRSIEDAEDLGRQGFAKLREAEATWQKALAQLRDDQDRERPRSVMTTSSESEKSRSNKLRKVRSERTWWGSRRS